MTDCEGTRAHLENIREVNIAFHSAACIVLMISATSEYSDTTSITDRILTKIWHFNFEIFMKMKNFDFVAQYPLVISASGVK